MTQSPAVSLVEALTNVIVGYGLAVILSLTVLPTLGVPIAADQALASSVVFTGASLARAYLLRRWFARRGQ